MLILGVRTFFHMSSTNRMCVSFDFRFKIHWCRSFWAIATRQHGVVLWREAIHTRRNVCRFNQLEMLLFPWQMSRSCDHKANKWRNSCPYHESDSYLRWKTQTSREVQRYRRRHHTASYYSKENQIIDFDGSLTRAFAKMQILKK